ncbi:YheC/YheD family protein [Polycladomyces sp. WAk]|uniref:YheC/YheD family protein n=1 Tax=Polycladomyces zharkentensis TaxID=2807616 RepID=A0ABS2WHI3_9BACL|nr:YheC/YheD family protein [Polycladomyces sp. WAk]MBN2908971.1 YheC/YheD family protein [Polycladomyces sp. WAk]
MSSIICRILPLSNAPTEAVILTQPLMEKWGCNNGQSVKISLGNKMLITRVISIRRRAPIIYLPVATARQLSIPYFGEVRVTFQNRCIKLGPVLAILTTGFTGSITSPFGSRTQLFRNFLVAGQDEKPYFYVFTPEMIDWQRGVINGWFLRKDKSGHYHWERLTSPFPDVIYERVPNRKSESLPHVQQCLNRLKSLTDCRVFNQGFFNKWSIHELLHNHPLTAPFIPESALCPSINQIQEMLNRHQMVYLKPSGGSLGLGIFRITRHPTSGYYCRFREGDKNILHRFHSLDKLIQYYFGKQLHRFERYLVQQGIRLIKYEGRPVDFRVHMHKDKSGQWQVVGIGTKVAGFGSVTTHVRTGGQLLSTSTLMQKIFGDEEQYVKEAIHEASIRIAQVLEEQIDGPLGELGLDIGVDRNHQVWLFEVNAKPGRHIFLHPDLRDAGRKSARYITEYSLRLANFV